jgi:serine-protein kinase ATM
MPVLSARQSLFGIISGTQSLQSILHVAPKDCRKVELQDLLSTMNLARQNGSSKDSLAAATYLSDIVPACRSIGLRVEAAADFEAAEVLWDQGEIHASIRSLRKILADEDFEKADFAPSSASVLAKLVWIGSLPFRS